jgi:hypothetical protein
MRFLMSFLVAFSCTTSSAPSRAAETDAVAWEMDYVKAVADARRTGKPIFLIFR